MDLLSNMTNNEILIEQKKLSMQYEQNKSKMLELLEQQKELDKRYYELEKEKNKRRGING